MLSQKPADKVALILFLIGSIALCTFAVIRAIYVPLTHDEAMTCSLFVDKPVFDIIGYVETYGMPNNHILNTLLIKLTTALFGNSTLAIRLPNLLALVLFLYASGRIILRMNSRYLQFAAMVLLCFNPYVFEFFTLARGYGIANALLMFTIWQLFQWWERPSNRKAIGVFLCGILMVMANFGTLHFYIALTLVFCFCQVRNTKPKSFTGYLKHLSVPLIALLALGGLLYEPFRCMMQWKPVTGSNTGYWEDCVVKLMNGITYGASYAYESLPFMQWFAGLGVVFFIVTSFVLLRNKTRSFQPLLVALLLLPVVFTQLQFLIMGTDFPFGRTVQFTYLVFVLCLLFSMQDITTFKPLPAAGIQAGVIHVVALASALIMGFHFFYVSNAQYAVEWDYDAYNRKVIDDLEQLKTTDSIQLHVGITWVCEPGLNYERAYRDAKWLAPLTRDGIGGEYDFYYVMREDSAVLAARGKKTVHWYPINRFSLMK